MDKFKLVPVEPTREMLQALRDVLSRFDWTGEGELISIGMANAFKAMLAAVPATDPPPHTSIMPVPVEMDFVSAVVKEASLSGVKRERFLWLAGIAYDAKANEQRMLPEGWWLKGNAGETHEPIRPFPLQPGEDPKAAAEARFPGRDPFFNDGKMK